MVLKNYEDVTQSKGELILRIASSPMVSGLGMNLGNLSGILLNLVKDRERTSGGS